MKRSDAVVDPRGPTPMWLPAPIGRVFAWYHPPHTASARRAAVLLCDPFGWQRMVLHLTYRDLAWRLAAQGFAAMRVDYPGTCDSEGSPRRHARLETWMQSLVAAAERLKEWSGAAELAVFGARLGGTLAALLARRRADVAALVLWEPYADGRAWLRAGAAATAVVDANPSGRRPSDAADGDREDLGFLLTREMQDDLATVQLLRDPPRGVRHALILQPADRNAEKLAGHLEAAGVAVTHHFEERETLDAVLLSIGTARPRRTIATIVRWLDQRFPETIAGSARPGPFPPAHVILDGGGPAAVRERVVWIGVEDSLFGIVSEPAEGPPSGFAVLFCGAGANHRVGTNRNFTEWARLLAAGGHCALRIDLRGIGDSGDAWVDAHAGGACPTRREILQMLYRDDMPQDVDHAARWLKERGARYVACVGLCSGGYHAFRAALAGHAIDAVVMLNPLRFEKEHTSDLSADVLPSERWYRALAWRTYARRIGWWLPAALRRTAVRLVPALSGRGPKARRTARSIAALVERGVDVCVIYNENEPVLGYVRRALRSVQRQLEKSGRFRLLTVGYSDHIFSPLWVQEVLTRTLIAHLQRLAAGAEPRGTAAPTAMADAGGERVGPGTASVRGTSGSEH